MAVGCWHLIRSLFLLECCPSPCCFPRAAVSFYRFLSEHNVSHYIQATTKMMNNWTILISNVINHFLLGYVQNWLWSSDTFCLMLICIMPLLFFFFRIGNNLLEHRQLRICPLDSYIMQLILLSSTPLYTWNNQHGCLSLLFFCILLFFQLLFLCFHLDP